MGTPFLIILDLHQKKFNERAYNTFKALPPVDQQAVIDECLLENKYGLNASVRIKLATDLMTFMKRDLKHD